MEDVSHKGLWQRYRETRDPRLKEELIRRYIHLVRLVVGRMRLHLPSSLQAEDLEGAGIVGFLLALEAFDPERDVDFPTYAQPRIKGAILDELRKLDPLPRSVRQKTKEIERALASLEQELGRQPEDEEVAAYLGLDLQDYYKKLAEVSGFGLLFLDDPGPAHDEAEAPPLHHQVEDPSADDPLRHLLTKERRHLLGRLIEALPLRERMVLALYYQEGLTLQEIGAVLEVSESRVSQLRSSAILRLRARLRHLGIELRDLAVEGNAHGVKLSRLQGSRRSSG